MIGTGYKSATAQLIGDGVVIEHFAIVPFALWIERRGKSKHLDGLQKSDDTLSIELDTCTGLVHVDGAIIFPYATLGGGRARCDHAMPNKARISQTFHAIYVDYF